MLFYLAGRRWDEPDPPPQALLPCVRAVAVRDTSEAAPSAGCRLMGPSGICVVRLEIPPAWFTPPQARKRPPEVTLPSLDVYYSIDPFVPLMAETLFSLSFFKPLFILRSARERNVITRSIDYDIKNMNGPRMRDSPPPLHLSPLICGQNDGWPRDADSFLAVLLLLLLFVKYRDRG